MSWWLALLTRERDTLALAGREVLHHVEQRTVLLLEDLEEHEAVGI